MGANIDEYLQSKLLARFYHFHSHGLSLSAVPPIQSVWSRRDVII